MLDSGYVDCYRTLHPNISGYTFPTWDPHLRLDYFFLPRVFSNRLISCEIESDPAELIRKASDHYPLSAEIDL
jgi:exonuclease III